MSFTTLAPSDFVVSSDSVTAPAWSTNTPTLSTFFTASSGVNYSYYIDVYNTGSNLINSAIQFSIAYGHILGSGSLPLNSLVPQNTPTRIIFGEYRNLVFGDSETNFNFGTGNTASLDLVALQIDRNRYKESLFPGTFNLQMKNSSGDTIKLTDNSKDVSTVTYVDGGRIYSIVSGSNGSAASSPLIAGAVAKGYTPSGSYGLFLPDIGLIVLNPKAIECPVGSAGGGLGSTLSMNSAATYAASTENLTKVFASIQSGSSFQLNSQETISSNYIFVRVPNAEYNYSTNPSFTSGSSGELIYSNFINSPQTYPTAIGLYNQNNELLAVAKMSKPLAKDFTKEQMIRIKLDW